MLSQPYRAWAGGRARVRRPRWPQWRWGHAGRRLCKNFL